MSEMQDVAAGTAALLGHPAALSVPLGKLAAAKASYSPEIGAYLTRTQAPPSIMGVAGAIRRAGPIGISAGTYAGRSAAEGKR